MQVRIRQKVFGMHGILRKDWFPYVLPFVVFLLFTELGRWVPGKVHIIYATKIIMVGSLLWLFRKNYRSDFSDNPPVYDWLISFFFGIVCLIIWILPEDHLPMLEKPTGLNPYSLGLSYAQAKTLIVIRLLGAAVIVPVMEELFWRSFLLRYLISPEFKKVRAGTFSWFSFIAVAVLFGLEHHRFVVGIIIGILFNLLMIWRKKLACCVFAHAVTNLGLAIYVLTTGSWAFW